MEKEKPKAKRDKQYTENKLQNRKARRPVRWLS